MPLDLLDLYSRASAWTTEKVGARRTDSMLRRPAMSGTCALCSTTCSRRSATSLVPPAARTASPPSPTPPELITSDPVADFERSREEMLGTFAEPGVLDKTGPALGIAFSD